METKRMHYVPKVYLKYFANKRNNDEYFIHAIKKSTGEIFETNIKNICVENDIYALPGETREERQFFETMYNQLYEVEYDSIYKILTNEDKESVTSEERYSVISFVASMFYRNATWKDFHNRFMDDIIKQGYNASKANGKNSFFFEGQEISIQGKTLEQLQKENQVLDQPLIVMTMAKQIFKLTRLRMINDVITVVKTSGEFQYLTSDNPVTIQAENNKYPVPIDATTTLAMPIDKNHLLQLRPWAHQLDKHMIGRMNEFNFIGQITVSINNQYQNGQSHKFVLGSLNDLEKFKERPGGIFQKKL